MKIAIIGGHLAPALAVMDALPSSDKVVFFGRAHAFEGDAAPSLESHIMREREVPFISLTTARLQRKMTKHTIPALFKLPVGFTQALQALKKEKPDVVLSFGGYLSLPVCLAAKTLGIPVVIHEQTLSAGVANKVVGKFADKICISWESSTQFFPPEKTVLTGNPLRKFQFSNFKYPISNDSSLPLLYITGGSAGSHAINVLIEGALEQFLARTQIIHQTGDAREFQDYARLEEKRKRLPEKLQERYVVQKFIDPQDVGSLMQEASLVVGRSGMNTVTELLYFGTPALLIPLPYGQHLEQQQNAQFLKEIGMAEILPQKGASPDKLTEQIFAMLDNLSAYEQHAKKGRELIQPDAAAQIIHQLSYVVAKTSLKEK